MAQIRLPGILAREAGGRNRIETDAATLAEALRALPISDLIFDEQGRLRPLVNVYLDGENVRDDLEVSLAPDATVHVVAAVAGG